MLSEIEAVKTSQAYVLATDAGTVAILAIGFVISWTLLERRHKRLTFTGVMVVQAVLAGVYGVILLLQPIPDDPEFLYVLGAVSTLLAIATG